MDSLQSFAVIIASIMLVLAIKKIRYSNVFAALRQRMRVLWISGAQRVVYALKASLNAAISAAQSQKDSGMGKRLTITLVVAAAMALVIWGSWLFRYEHLTRGYLLDRWTGEVVLLNGKRIDLSDHLTEDPPGIR